MKQEKEGLKAFTGSAIGKTLQIFESVELNALLINSEFHYV